MKKLYDELRASIRAKDTHYIASDGWLETSALCITEYAQPNMKEFKRLSKTKLELTYAAYVTTDNDYQLPAMREKLAKHIYNSLYGEIISRLSEVSWHIERGERDTAYAQCMALLDTLTIK